MNEFDLVGQKYVFEDGASIEVTQIKVRDENKLWVTYYTHSGPGIPRKYVMVLEEFKSTYGHLFGLLSDTNQPDS